MYQFRLHPPGQNISFVYNYVGLYHHEMWWLINKAKDGSYVLMYYCGHTLQWSGTMKGLWYLVVIEASVMQHAYANIASAFQQAVGLDASKFCIPQALPLTALIDENLYAQRIVEQFSVVVDMSIIP